jgi:hypothetical protein
MSLPQTQVLVSRDLESRYAELQARPVTPDSVYAFLLDWSGLLKMRDAQIQTLLGAIKCSIERARILGADVVGRGQAESPGSGGASPCLRRTCHEEASACQMGFLRQPTPEPWSPSGA